MSKKVCIVLDIAVFMVDVLRKKVYGLRVYSRSAKVQNLSILRILGARVWLCSLLTSCTPLH